MTACSPPTQIDPDDPATRPDISLTLEEAKAAVSPGCPYGLMLDGYTPFFPGVPLRLATLR